MPIADAEMYLPLSENTLNQLLCDTTHMAHKLHTLSLAEYSSLFLINRLPELKKNGDSRPEQFIAKAIEIGNIEVRESGLQSYIDSTHSILSKAQIYNGRNLLSDFKITQLDDKDIALREYISSDGSWDYDFKDKQNKSLMEGAIKIHLRGSRITTLTAEQNRIYREFESQTDEQTHIQGYAGTGKSTFIFAILNMLEQSNAQVLLLTQTKGQLSALAAKSDLSAKVHKNTFSGMAQQILHRDLTSHANNNFGRIDSSNATMPDSQLIQMLGVCGSGGFSAHQMIAAVRGTLFKFCQSDSDEISYEHLPQRYKSTFDNSTRTIICHFTTELWKLFQRPKSGRQNPQVRGFHIIKWAALNHCQIPGSYTHILLDECHNLPKSVLQILNNSPQALLSLGDEYQRLKGAAPVFPEYVRQRELSHSVRSGTQLETIVNPIITVHPGLSKPPFHGNQNSRIDIEYYKVAKVPDSSAVILVNEMWGLFEWAQRIAANSTGIQLLSNAKELDMFVQDCIELYNTGSRARHPELFRFAAWENVERHNRKNPGFQRINRMLEKGFSFKDWEQTLSKFINNNTRHRGLALGLIADTLNHEFDNVMLTPDIFRGSTSSNHAEFCSTLYVGVTRARNKLLVPESLRNWIEELESK